MRDHRGCSAGVKGSGSVDAASGSRPAGRAENGMLRPSRAARLRAQLARIVKIHVRRLDRPSNRSRPRTTLIQASCTTSSATAWLDT